MSLRDITAFMMGLITLSSFEAASPVEVYFTDLKILLG
ncbi:hypothetical protein BH10BAC4_BH10BAC4_13630 [soil metagenome]